MISTGGSLKPIKCFYHIILFVWSSDGRWKYESNEEDEELDIAVPMPDGSLVTIEHVAVGKSKETFGVHTCPSEGNKGALKSMQDKAQGWVDKSKNRKLKRISVWFLLEKQFEVWLVRQHGQFRSVGRLSSETLLSDHAAWRDYLLDAKGNSKI